MSDRAEALRNIIAIAESIELSTYEQALVDHLKMSLLASPRTCSHPGCTIQLHENSKTGRCMAHQEGGE